MKKMMTCILMTMVMITLSVQSVCAYEPWIEEYFDPADHIIDMSNGINDKSDAVRYSNRYAAYFDVVEKCIEQYGDTDCASGPSYGTQMFTGLSFLKLVDFNEDGEEELMLVFNSRPKDDSNGYSIGDYVYNIWGYDGKQPVLLKDGMGLFGSNGGIQTISFVKNPFGIFLRRGAADGFRYDFYYGYEAETFGLCKSLVWELKYNEETKRSEQVYYADDELVTEDFYNSEKELWDGGPSSYAEENYLLTPYNAEEKDTVWNLIDETIRFLQQHCQELSVTQEKGKTLLNVQFHQAQENPPVYILVQRNMDTGEEKTIALLQPPSTIDDEEDQEYTITYDFSTHLNLESGSYQFMLKDQMAPIDAVPVAMLWYDYDESEKIAEDDEFGNEREYRRLLKNSSSPVENEQFLNNIVQRLTNFGLSSKKIDTIIADIKAAQEPYRSLYLYSFYNYSYQKSGNIQFAPDVNKIRISENAIMDIVINAEFYTTFFHESGHAIDYHAGTDGYYTMTVDAGHITDLIIQDARMNVSRLVEPWFKENSDSVLSTEDELVEKIFNHLFSSEQEVKREDCHDLSGNEYEAYKYVEKSLQDQIGILSTLKNGDNLDMTDVLMGLTSNKIAPTILGKKITGHPTDYWYKADEETGEIKITGKYLVESWTECFTALFLKNDEMIASNDSYFPLTCEYYRSMAESLLQHYKSVF